MFLFPGGHFFEALAAPTPDGASESGAAADHCWLVEYGDDRRRCEMFMLASGGASSVHSLSELLDRLNLLPSSEAFRIHRQPEPSCVRCLA